MGLQGALFTGVSGLTTYSNVINIIGNNIANVNTAGFKKSRVDFQDLLYDTLRAPGTASSLFAAWAASFVPWISSLEAWPSSCPLPAACSGVCACSAGSGASLARTRS